MLFLLQANNFRRFFDMKEWVRFDWAPEAISFYGIAFFILFGSVALFIQGRKIWKHESGLSVSTTWTFNFFFFFVASVIIGVERQNALLSAQGIFRVVFYLPIIWGLSRFKGFTRQEVVLARTLFLMIFIMIEYPRTGEMIYATINLFGVLGVFAQGLLIRKEKSAGVVSAILLFAYAANATLWVWYMHAINDQFLFLNSTLFLLAYVYTITTWLKFRRI